MKNKISDFRIMKKRVELIITIAGKQTRDLPLQYKHEKGAGSCNILGTSPSSAKLLMWLEVEIWMCQWVVVSKRKSGEGKMVMEPWCRSAKWMEDMEVETRVRWWRRWCAKGETQVSGVQFVSSYSRTLPNQGEGGPDPGYPAGNLTCLVLGWVQFYFIFPWVEILAHEWGRG